MKIFKINLMVLCLLGYMNIGSAQWDTYPNYQEYLEIMDKFEADYPGICKIDSFGTSVEGRKLLAAKISDSVSQSEREPAFFYSATMSGQQIAGYVTMLHLIDYLLSNYGSDPFVTRLVDSIEIWINPLINPDGTYAGGDSTVSGAKRENANGIDLNRDFHDPVNGLNTNLQKETEALINFEQQNGIAMGADIRSSEYVIYPWACQAAQTADLQWWALVSQQYVDTAREYGPAGFFTTIPAGHSSIYSFAGQANHGLRIDCSLYYNHCRTPVIGIANNTQLPDSLLTDYWDYNYRSLLNYTEQVLYGIRGTVTDSLGNPVEAKVFINGHDKDSSHVYSHLLHGDYYRPIYEGTYEIIFSAEGYIPKTIPAVGVENNKATVLDVTLSKVSSSIGFTCKNPHDISINIIKGLLKITYCNESSDNIKIAIFDISGRVIRRFEPENNNGTYTINWERLDNKGRIISNGCYIVQVQIAEETYSQCFILSH